MAPGPRANGRSGNSARSGGSSPDNSDLIELRLALIDHALALVSYVQGGQPNRALSNRRSARWGRKGAFTVDLTGQKRGLWYDHEAGEGGDLLDLVRRRITGGSFADAVRWARDWLGWPVDGPAPVETAKEQRRQEQAQRIAKAEAEEAKERRRRIGVASEIWARTVPISGTVAERYVRETRAIPVETWPETVRFDPVEHALALQATRGDGEFCGVQIVRLTPEGLKIPGDGPKPVKQSFGALVGAAVRLPGAEGPLCLAEGPETGLSIWAATGRETWVALGGIGKVEPAPGRELIICRDDDRRDAPAMKAITRAITAWRKEGIETVSAWPWETRRQDKSDFNDLIRAAGPEAVAKRIEAVAGKPQRIAQRLVTVEEGRARLNDRVGEFFRLAEGWDPEAGLFPVHALGVSLGTGKTEAAMLHAGGLLARLRDKGDARAVVIAVPEHRLSAEIEERFKRMNPGLTVAIWRGREARAPGSKDDRMCAEIETVRQAQAVYADIEAEVCDVCPLKSSCAYLAQRAQDADLWIVAHPLLFQAAPAAVSRRRVAAIVVDESPWQAGLIGVSGTGIELALDALEHMPIPKGDGPDGGARLADIRQRLRLGLQNEPIGYVSRAALVSAGFDHESGAVARRLEWQRKVDVGPWRERDANRTLGSANALWDAVDDLMQPDGPDLSGRIELVHNRDGARALRMYGRKDVAETWQAPTLLIDATLDPELVRPYWPQIEVKARIEVEAPFMTVRQAAGRPFSKAMLAPLGEIPRDSRERAAEALTRDARKAKARRRIRASICRIDRENSGETLVVSNKEIIEGLDLPPHISRAWFNAVAGRDQWRNARTVVVLGRPQPSPSAVERIAGALTGKAPSRIKGWYPRADIVRRQRSGEHGIELVPGEADAHPDPLVERIRSRIAEGEIMQAIGRGRGVNRTAEAPLDVLVLSDAVLPIPVDEFVPDDLATKPSPADQMLAEGGVAFEDAQAASEAYPDLWPSNEAARKDINRRISGTNPYKDTLIRECPADRLVTVAYQRSGSKRHMARAVVDLRLAPDPRQAIEALVGPLAHFEIIEVERQAEPAEVIELVPKPADQAANLPVYPKPAEAPAQVIDFERLKVAARDGGVKLGDIAKEIGVSFAHLSNATHGRRRLKPDIEARLAEIVASIPQVQGRLL